MITLEMKIQLYRNEIASHCKKSINVEGRKSNYKSYKYNEKNDILLIAGKGHEKPEIKGKVYYSMTR